jgi:hypothetical protein
MVPKWFLANWFQEGARSTMVLAGWALFLIFGIWLMGSSNLSLVLDLPQFTTIEGGWLFAAKEVSLGSKGNVFAVGIYPLNIVFMPLLRGDALQDLLLLRHFSLLCMAALSALFVFEAKSKSLPNLLILLLSFLLFLWSQNSSNTWNPLVPAILFFFIGALFQRANLWKMGVAIFLFSSLFDFRIFFAALIYLIALTLYEKKNFNSIFYFVGTFSLMNLAFGFIYGYTETLLLWKMYFQISYQQGFHTLDRRILGAPLSVMGAWILSFYFWRAKINYRIAAILAVTSYLALSVFREGISFVFGLIYCFPIFIILGMGALVFSEKKKITNQFEILLLSSVMAMCFFPLGSISNALAIFPFYLFAGIYILYSVSIRYPSVWRVWWYFPFFIFLFGGAAQQVRTTFLQKSAKPNSWGLKSVGTVDRWLNDAADLEKKMKDLGWNPSDEVEIEPENFALRAFWSYAYPRTGNPTYRISIEGREFVISKMNK